MVETTEDNYVVVTHINLNKQGTANSDLALYLQYLSKGFHLDQNDVIRGMDAFRTEFRYELSHEAVSEDEEEEEELLPHNQRHNVFARRGGRPQSVSPQRPQGDSRAHSTSSMETANSSVNSTRNQSPIGSFAPITIKQQNQQFQLKLRDFLRKAKNNTSPQDAPKGPRPINKPQGWIIGCQEPNVNKSNKITHLENGGNVIIMDRRAKHPRAALIISSNINAWCIDSWTDADIATCRIENSSTEHKVIYCCSVYQDYHNKDVINTKLRKLTKHCTQNKFELLILSDCNSWSTLWNMPKSNTRGKKMEHFIMESGLQVLNKGTEVTFHREGVGTIIDVTLASPKIAQNIVGWAVTNVCPSSDHLAPQMVLKLDNMKKEVRWNFHKTHWPGFTDDLEITVITCK